MKMKQIQVEPFPGQGRKYLYHKTDARTNVGTAIELSPESALSKKDNNLNLFGVSTDISFGDAFLAYASDQLESAEYFSTMVIRPDPVDSKSDTRLISMESIPLLIDLIDRACKTHEGFWGIYGDNYVVCFNGEKTCDKLGMQIAEEIRKELQLKDSMTVSMGMANYPCLSYRKEDIIGNACKALEHAHFLGHNSTVKFDAVSLNISGDKLYQQGNIDAAIFEFEQALLMDPKNVNVINSLGVCFGVQGEHQKAIDMFETAIKTDPCDVMAPYNAGLAYLMTGNKEKAGEFFLRAFSLDQNQLEVVLQLGRLYLETKDPGKAIKYFEKAIGIDAESGPAHRFLGECYNELNDYDKAVEFYSKAVKFNANDAYSLSALACLYAQQGINRDIAVVFGKQSVELSPSNALFRQRLGKVYYLLEMFEQALNEYKCATKLGNDCLPLILEIENRVMTR